MEKNRLGFLDISKVVLANFWYHNKWFIPVKVIETSGNMVSKVSTRRVHNELGKVHMLQERGCPPLQLPWNGSFSKTGN